MHLVALLWFALLHSFTLPGCLPAEGAETASSNASINASTNASAGAAVLASGTSWTLADVPMSRLVLRAPAGAVAALVSQASSAVIPDRSDATLLQRTRYAAATFLEPLAGSSTSAGQHVVSSRGDLLPYFPTAPPQRD